MSDSMLEKAGRLIGELTQGLFRWYDFPAGSSSLLICAEDVEKNKFISLPDGMSVCSAKEVSCLSGIYDYIIGIGILDKSLAPEEFLQELLVHLSEDGRMLLFAENRLAIKYFCGEKDAYTQKVLDGIDNYRYYSQQFLEKLGGRAYAKAELREIISNAGLYSSFYSVYPALERPQLIIADNYLPKENLNVRIFPQYRSPDTVFLHEEWLYDTLAENGLLHGMANGFFIECSRKKIAHEYKQITVSPDRGHDNALATILRSDGKVVKKALYSEGKCTIEQLYKNNVYLQQRGIPMVEMKLQGDAAEMPLVEQETALSHFRKIFTQDLEKLMVELQQFWELILQSSEHVPYSEINWYQFVPGWEKLNMQDTAGDKWSNLAHGTLEEQQSIGPILRHGYIDLIALNCFYKDGRFTFYDQECYMENLPAKVILLRTIDCIYDEPTKEAVFPKAKMLERFGLAELEKEWRDFAWVFLTKLRNEKELAVYHKKVRADWQIVHENRQRMNYSQSSYDKYYSHIFDDIDGRELFLFGSGVFAKRFVDNYGSKLPIRGFLDNNPARWGKTCEGMEIFSPSYVQGRETRCKVIICIKDYEPVLRQLQDMGVFYISVYNPGMIYHLPSVRKDKMDHNASRTVASSKKYGIGYVAGVFDMFHRGHLNLLQRAKEQCDYLIVGVCTDEQVFNNKRTKPMISFADRLAIVQGCRYVDEAVEIPYDNSSTEYAHQQYHFDAQFSGSDYEDDPYWLAAREYLRKNGADLVFFPYTESVSSTKLKLQLKEADKAGRGDGAK